MRSEQEVSTAIDLYGDTVKRLCFIYLKNNADAEDIFQNVFLKYALSSVEFENREHEKSWIIRVTSNCCKDLLRNFFRSHTVDLDQLIDYPQDEKEDTRYILEAIISLDRKYREVIYLHYIEGYTAPEIGKILKKNVNTVYTLIKRGKDLLRECLGGDEFGR